MSEAKQQYWFINKKQKDYAEVFLYGEIGSWGDTSVSASGFVKELRQLESEYNDIRVRINSVGGSVYEGLAIYNAIKNSKCNIDTYIDGIAASMGSAIAMAGRKTYMSRIARLMTHKASSGAFGNSDEIKEVLKELEAIDNILAGEYAAKTGCTVEDATKKYLNGTDMFFSAEEALKEKLIDGIYDGETIEIPKGLQSVNALWKVYNVIQPPVDNAIVDEVTYFI